MCAKGPGSGRGTRPAAHLPPQAGAELRTWSGWLRTRVAAAAELQQARPQPAARQPPAPAPSAPSAPDLRLGRLRAGPGNAAWGRQRPGKGRVGEAGPLRPRP